MPLHVLIHHRTLFILHNNSYTTDISYITDRCKPSASYSTEDDDLERLLVGLNLQIHSNATEETESCRLRGRRDSMCANSFYFSHVQQDMEM